MLIGADRETTGYGIQQLRFFQQIGLPRGMAVCLIPAGECLINQDSAGRDAGQDIGQDRTVQVAGDNHTAELVSGQGVGGTGFQIAFHDPRARLIPEVR